MGYCVKFDEILDALHKIDGPAYDGNIYDIWCECCEGENIEVTIAEART